MTKSVEAIITPEILVWARLASGYSIDTISQKMKMEKERLKKWENGEKKPTINQLRRLANYYKRPIAVFYLSEVPDIPEPIKDFRRIEVELLYKEPVKLQMEIRRALYRREVALELLRELNEKPIDFPHKISISDDPEQISGIIRNLLKIDIEKQIKWKDKYEALNSWISTVENLGVFVFQASGIEPEEMRGFSISDFPLPVIGLNIKDHPHARIFSLLHELTHLMLNESGICDIYEGVNFRRIGDIERFESFCNHVAGATIIPIETLVGDELVRDKSKNYKWTDNDLRALSLKFRASREAVLRRLLIAGKTTPNFYKTKRQNFLKTYDDYSKAQKAGPVPVYRKVISYNGLSFTNIVIDSYYQGNITPSDLSDFLNTNIKHLPKIEAEAIKKAQKLGVAI